MNNMILVVNTVGKNKIIIALAKSRELLLQRELATDYNQGELLLPAIDEILKKSRARLKDLKGLVVVTGPGSFTALRIGVATANTLAFALGIPVAGLQGSEFKNLEELLEQGRQKLSQRKPGQFIWPLYGQEPSVRSKNSSLR